MEDRNKKRNEGKDPRRSARQTGKTCGRPFKAPRLVTQAKTDIVRDMERRQEPVVPETEVVRVVPETANDRDMERRQEPVVSETEGVRVVPETEGQETSSDSEDNVPVASLLRPKSSSTLSLLQIEECKRGQLEKKL